MSLRSGDRLILTSRTFAQTRRTYDSLAAELGVGRERVRQLETSALQQLAIVAAHDRYRPLRWRAASAAQPDVDMPPLSPVHPRGWATCCPGLGNTGLTTSSKGCCRSGWNRRILTPIESVMRVGSPGRW